MTDFTNGTETDYESKVFFYLYVSIEDIKHFEPLQGPLSYFTKLYHRILFFQK